MGEFTEQAKLAVLLALKEDIGAGDVTSLATIPSDMLAEGRFLVKSSGIIAGLEIVELTYRLLEEELFLTDCEGGRMRQTGEQSDETDRRRGDRALAPALDGSEHAVRPRVRFCSGVADGARVDAGTVIATAAGPAQLLLTAERVALNFLQRMSGIATLTRRYVEAAQGAAAAGGRPIPGGGNRGAVILDTRKTAPGLRVFDKRAVALGGGRNHRFGLFDMALVKDNHIAAAGGITPAVQRVRERYDGLPIEVEVVNLTQLEEALSLDLDRILLDNMTTEQIREAVRIAAGRTPLEASGGVNLENVAALAGTGVDSISVGALTHSAPALDISFDLIDV